MICTGYPVPCACCEQWLDTSVGSVTESSKMTCDSGRVNVGTMERGLVQCPVCTWTTEYRVIDLETDQQRVFSATCTRP